MERAPLIGVPTQTLQAIDGIRRTCRCRGS
jgi:hypothetical protein